MDPKRDDLSPMTFRFGCAALALYAFAILSIGLTKDWRLRNEDAGAFYSSLALSHLRLGLATTRAHDLLFNPHTGEAVAYGHHPPGLALALAAAFAATGSDAPAVARGVAIAFHLGSLFLLVSLVARVLSKRDALVAGFLMATLPMSAYFGRMAGYEPPCLFAVLVQLRSYASWKLDGRRRNLVGLALGVLLGAFLDWSSFFFTLALAIAESVDVLRKRSRLLALLVVLGVTALVAFLLDVLHLWYAAHGSLHAFSDVLEKNRPLWEETQKLTPVTFFLSQLETYRRYFTHAGLVSSLLAGFSLVAPRSTLARRLFDVPGVSVVRRLLAVSGGAALAYVLAAPRWADLHHYWQFYFLPFVVIAMVLVLRLLGRAVRETPTALLRGLRVAFALEILITSAYVLRLRHTKEEAYAVRYTAFVRANYLVPRSAERAATHPPAPESP